jgi:hypothetical protein
MPTDRVWDAGTASRRLDSPAMAAPVNRVVAELSAVLAEYDNECAGNYRYLEHKDESVALLRARLAAAVDRLAPASSSYVREANTTVAIPGWYSVVQLAGIVTALRDDYAAGYMTSVEGLIHADVFADFLEMAEELTSKGYKDAGAVIAGSVLEEHLRKLAAANGVSVHVGTAHKNADVINADLVKEGAYNKLEQKNVTAWLGLRNDAAHGSYGNYDKAMVEGLIRDVRDFMVRHPG